MWLRTRSTTRSRTARGWLQALEEGGSELRTDRVVTEKMAVGQRRRLADVVEERGQPNDRPRHGDRIDGSERVVPEVLSRDLVLGDAALGGELRRRSVPASPESAINRSPTDGRGAPSILSSSAAIRSPERWATSSARSRIPASVLGSSSNPSVVASRTARIIRSASSSKRVVGVPTARRRRASASDRPSYGSTRAGGSPGRAPQAIALTVKSRRARSSSIVSPNSTRCGRRKSA